MPEWTLILPLGLAAGILFTKWNARHRLKRAGVREIGARETMALIKEKKALVVDVREASEFKAGRIPKAKHIPLRQVGKRIKELEKHKGRPIIVNCRSGRRSASASMLLSKNGFDNVYNLKGGIIAWNRANLKLEK
ncbi:MAG: rhodanese-like domain-containing protein [Actinobacteria bacterium]|nr:rhodanese-like domain-containing protein [Actinomycetota bacterium]